ncbi:penicillin acylase family protein [Kordiimonas marina]|uniref:penicillin acylase family protein n=1 Tax=Kordiimonas marina TaxID=2872312 RepID=UPI001FF4E00A|nr:penicillin acylase family protein [Kordiimonas marina]MCJ9429167.1 penicillin acylase family protein [Kordiimonas marina]
MRKLKLWAAIIGGLVLMIALIGTAWVRSSLPKLDGTITVKGPTADITIARDSHDVPHIDAATDNDLYFAMGYVHAQDRLWQMEINRRIGHGRLAEVVGKPGLGIDRYMRTLGFSRKAEAALKQMPADVVASLQAYADGVNAYIKGHKGALPPEFLLTGDKPEPWKPVDTIVWQKLMWLDLSGNMRREIARARLLTKLTPTQVQSIYPAYPGDKASALPDLASIYAKTPLKEVASIVGPEMPPGYGSNNWVISGDHTKSGKPLLANDPHLTLTTPSIWYLVRLHNRTTGANLVGVSFPGTPSVVLGHNDHIAWGFTNTEPDCQDLFIEKLVDGGKRYLTPHGPADFITHKEVIHVKGEKDVTLTVRETRHGPVLSDALSDGKEFLKDGYVLSLQWTALMDRETAVAGLFGIAKARTFQDFKTAGLYYMGPEQNMIYADTKGNIGYYAPALVPVRKPGNDIGGRLPSPGWLAQYDWQGFIPYNQLPTYYNPKGGIIATANNKIIDDNYPHFITGDWTLPYRANRIKHLLAAHDGHDLASFKTIQQDTVSDMIRDLLPSFLAAANPSNPIVQDLAKWNGDTAADRPEPLIFHEWIRKYQKALMADELGDMYKSFRRIEPRLLKSSLYWEAKAHGNAPADTAYYNLPPIDQKAALAWCDNVQTPDVQESCTDLARTALEETIKDLSARHGKDWKKWTWESEHILHQAHRPFSNVPSLRPWFELSAPVSGDVYTINVAGVSETPATLNQSTFGPSYRGLFDLSDLDKSLFVQPTGQSGNPLSSHYDDLFPYWRTGRYFTIPTDKPVPADAKHILTLHPAAPEKP